MYRINSVLIVDDDPVYSFLTHRTIERAGITSCILSGQNGLEGLQKLSEFDPVNNVCPELIIVDMEMPVMDGMDFIHSFQEMNFVNKKQVHIIVNSSTLHPSLKAKLMLMNIPFYLLKPLTPQIIREIAETVYTKKVYSILSKG